MKGFRISPPDRLTGMGETGIRGCACPAGEGKGTGRLGQEVPRNLSEGRGAAVGGTVPRLWVRGLMTKWDLLI